MELPIVRIPPSVAFSQSSLAGGGGSGLIVKIPVPTLSSSPGSPPISIKYSLPSMASKVTLACWPQVLSSQSNKMYSGEVIVKV